MSIDLNTLPDLHGELLPNLSEQPQNEQEDEIMSLQQDQVYEDEAHLQDQHGHLLPDLNKNPMYEHEDEIAHLQKKITFMKMKPISKVSPFIFITMNDLVCMSLISMLLLLRENKNIIKVILFS